MFPHPTATLTVVRLRRDGDTFRADDAVRLLGDTRVDGLVPVEVAARHVMYAVVARHGPCRLADVEEVAVLVVRLPHLAHGEVTLVTVDGCSTETTEFKTHVAN